MNIRQITSFSFVALLLFLILAAVSPSPLTIFIAASGTGVVVMIQTYLILKDDGNNETAEQQTELPNYQRK